MAKSLAHLESKRKITTVQSHPNRTLSPPKPNRSVILSGAEAPAVALAVACFPSQTKQIRHPERSAAEPKDLRLPLLVFPPKPNKSVILSEAEGPAVAFAVACFPSQTKQIRHPERSVAEPKEPRLHLPLLVFTRVPNKTALTPRTLDRSRTIS
jgi:hypothetical protein